MDALQGDFPAATGAEQDGDQSTASSLADTHPAPLTIVPYSGPSLRPSADVRRGIHQHAMRAIGRARRKPRPPEGTGGPPSVELDPEGLLEEPGTLLRPVLESRDGADASMHAGLGGHGGRWMGSGVLDPFAPYPVAMTAEERGLVAFTFYDSDGGMQRPMRNAWFSIGLADAATFHQVMSNSALHLYSLRHGGRLPRETPASCRYLLRAIASVAARLGSCEARVQDALVGAVTGLMCHDEIIGDWARWRLHYEGIQQMIRVRGGIDVIEANRNLRLSISWVELRGVFFQDLCPVFPLPDEWHYRADGRGSSPPSTSPPLEARLADHLREWNHAVPGCSEWMAIFADLARASEPGFGSDDGSSAGRSTDLQGDGAWTLPLLYRLLVWRPLPSQGDTAPSPGELLQETCRLGALLFVAPVWRHHGVHPVRSRILSRKLESLVPKDATAWSEQGALWTWQLWALYMGAVEQARDAGLEGTAEAADLPRALEAAIAELLARHGVESWPAARRLLSNILLPETLFGAKDAAVGARVACLVKQRLASNLQVE